MMSSRVPRALLSASALLLAIPSLFSQTRRPITVDDEMKMRSIVDVRIAPDGQRVAYVVSSPNLGTNEHDVSLYIVGTDGGEPRRLGADVSVLNRPLPAPQLRWLPDGTALSVLALTEERPQVFVVPVSGEAPRRITAAQEGVTAFEWAPDGRSLAYVTVEPMSAEEARQRQDKSFVIHVGKPERPTRLVVQKIDGQAPRVLTPLDHYVDSLSWAPAGDEIAYSAAPRSGFGSAYHTRLYAIAAAGGTPRAIVDRSGMNTLPQYSPDGRSIAFISTGGRAEIIAPRSLTVVASNGGAPRAIPMDDAWVNEIAWAPDSRSVYVQTNDGTFASRGHMFEQPIVRVPLDGSAPDRVPASQVNFSLSVSRDGRTLAYRGVDGASMGDVFVRDTASARTKKLTEVNPELRDLAVGELKPISWRSFDGMEIWGLLLTPAGWTSGTRLPLLVYIHGGPGGGVTFGHFPQFMTRVGQVDPYPTQAMASAGFAVLFPMPRGGAGYGEAGQRMIVNAWGEGDYKDIMAGVDDLIARGVADPERLGVMGASYGGYMTNWIVTQTGRFKAASAGASLSDLTDGFYLSEGGEFMAEYFKRPWENRESYAAHSPITHVERVTTPLLLQHGENDPRVAIAGAWKFYRALKALGKTVEFDIYPRGRHVLYEPMQQREAMRRNLEWFTRWIPPVHSTVRRPER
jgi:dipeptidyl aminopeptidase/acylaminoacyl peptidase